MMKSDNCVMRFAEMQQSENPGLRVSANLLDFFQSMCIAM